MRRSRAYIIIGTLTALLLFASCGQRQAAKGLVKDFIQANAAHPEQIDITSFSDLDSTRVISDSLIQAMRTKAEHDTLFKKGLKYTAERQGATLLYIRMKYGNDSLAMSRTFYFDRDLTGIVAFK